LTRLTSDRKLARTLCITHLAFKVRANLRLPFSQFSQIVNAQMDPRPALIEIVESKQRELLLRWLHRLRDKDAVITEALSILVQEELNCGASRLRRADVQDAFHQSRHFSGQVRTVCFLPLQRKHKSSQVATLD
jgi:hypothetical protein